MPLGRRRIGLFGIITGVAMVAVGLFTNLQDTAPQSTAVSTADAPGLVYSATAAPVSVLGLLRHLIGDPVAGGGAGKLLADFGIRAGCLLIALALAATVLFAAVPPLRGFVGPACGAGLAGCGLLAAVVFAESARFSVVTGPSISAVQLSVGWWLCVAGFAIALVGGGLASIRPLAGVVSGLTLVATGAGLSALLGLVVSADHIIGPQSG